MANPSNAREARYQPDPSDIVPFVMLISRGSDTFDILQAGESIVSFELNESATGEEAGLVIIRSGARAPALQDDGGDTLPRIGFWFSINGDMQDDGMFDRDGKVVGVECTIVTDADPSVTKQFTLLIRVKNN